MLKGHSTTILHLSINSSVGQVLSFSKDMVTTSKNTKLYRMVPSLILYPIHQELRVWDIQDQLCLQSCNRFQPLAPQLPSAFYLHPASGTILIGTNQVSVLELAIHYEFVSYSYALTAGCSGAIARGRPAQSEGRGCESRKTTVCSSV